MSIALAVFLFSVGLIFTVKGSDVFVETASRIATASRIPRFIIGATLISVATTLPEIFVSVFASIEGMPDMAFGTSVGSVTANFCVMIALSFIYMPTIFKRLDYVQESALMVAAILLLGYCAIKREIGVVSAILLLAVFALFLIQNIRSAYQNTVPDVFKFRTQEDEDKEERLLKRRNNAKDVLKFILSAAFVLVGSQLLVYNGGEIARILGVSERVISTTVIALGTSLPEMITAITAFSKKQSSISFGNIVGANIIDLTLILPLTTLISGGSFALSWEQAGIDITICAVVTLLTLIPSFIKGKFMRWQGALLVCIYSAYFCITCGLITV
ncbi:MAG: calcium/sodium antiporter [Clostridia bacterium]|nr:calcium/sodium antiporter [Clostridia bacterium]